MKGDDVEDINLEGLEVMILDSLVRVKGVIALPEYFDASAFANAKHHGGRIVNEMQPKRFLRLNDCDEGH